MAKTIKDIKFRAWDKLNESMRDVLGVSLYHESISVDRGDGTYFANHASNFELMQYTGLKDKNGVEIYEGDIVKFYDIWDELTVGRGEGHQRICRVEYVGSSFLVVQGDEDGYEQDLFMAKINDDNLEVIGNIYENPELLESDRDE